MLGFMNGGPGVKLSDLNIGPTLGKYLFSFLCSGSYQVVVINN